MNSSMPPSRPPLQPIATVSLPTPSAHLTLVGTWTLESPLRITATDPTLSPSGDLVLSAQGQPYIPGSTMRGAWRIYLEGVLRGMAHRTLDRQVPFSWQGNDGRTQTFTRTVHLCCDPSQKVATDTHDQGCLNAALIQRWENDPVLRHHLDQLIMQYSCEVCRLFGNAWLASRVMIPDLALQAPTTWQRQTRGGVMLNRDTDTAIEGSSYQRDYVASGLSFHFKLIADRLSSVEQGMIFLVMRAFQAGIIGLGADRARGAGIGRLTIAWDQSRLLESARLIEALLGRDAQPLTEADVNTRIQALAVRLGRTNAPTASNTVSTTTSTIAPNTATGSTPITSLNPMPSASPNPTTGTSSERATNTDAPPNT